MNWTNKLSKINALAKREIRMKFGHEYYDIDHFYKNTENLIEFFDVDKF